MASSGRNHMHRHAAPEKVRDVRVPQSVESHMRQLGRFRLSAKGLREMRRVNQPAIRPVRKDEIHLAEPHPQAEAGMLFAVSL